MKNTLTIATVCMNRTFHLRETVIKNIADNIDDDRVSFALLDYNSADDMEEWARAELGSYLATGKVCYYKTFDPISFSQSHSRNLLFRVLNTEIICNVDADNFTGTSYGDYVLRSFENKNIFISGNKDSQIAGDSGIYGRLCMRSADFQSARGYDEHMTTYGFEDTDLKNRLVRMGLQEVTLDKKYAHVIPHSIEVRLANEAFFDIIEFVAVRFVNHFASELFFCYKDGTIESGKVIDNFSKLSDFPSNCISSLVWYRWKFSIENDFWTKGRWHWHERSIKISFDTDFNGQTETTLDCKSNLTSLIFDKRRLNEIFIFKSVITNRVKMEINETSQLDQVNPQGFGKGILYKNFDLSNPIYLS